MAPKMYDRGDYALYLCEEDGRAFVTYERTFFKRGEMDYVYELSSNYSRNALHAIVPCVKGVKIGLSGRNSGIVELQNQFGVIHHHTLSEESHSVIKEAVKILIDHIMRRDLLDT